MRIARLASVCMVVAAFCLVTAYAQPIASGTVKGTIRLSQDKLQQGSEFQVAVVLKIPLGYHIYGSDKNAPYPTTLAIAPSKDLSFGKTLWPKLKKLELAGEKVDAYDGEVVIRVNGKVAKAAKPGKRTIGVTVKCLPCEQTSCLAPVELKLRAEAAVVSAKTKAKRITQKRLPGVSGASSRYTGIGKHVSGPRSRNTDRGGLGVLGSVIRRWGMLIGFIAVFFMGVALAFFPCVYPLIPVTVAFFAAQKGNKRPLGLCAVYVLGIAITYSTIGGAAAAVGGMLGSALRYPFVLWSVAAVIVLLALSMFGLFQLRVPSFIADRAAAKSGLPGALAMGLLMGVVAAPCGAGLVAPIISLAAASQSVPFGIAIFFVFSIGLGIPYMILGLFSHKLANVPSAGPWMVTIERIFAFILIGVALYIVSPLLPHLVVEIAGAGIAIIAGIYLAVSGKPSPTKRPLRLVIGLLIVLAGIGGMPWRGDMVGKPATEVAWVKYSPEIIEQARSDRKPVMMDFGAEWCLYCKKLERTTFRDPQVVKLSRSMIAVKVDLTKHGVPELDGLRKEMKIVGLPTVVFLDREGNEIEELRITDYVKPEKMLKSMRAALE